MDRREFGRRVFEVAASLGLHSVSASLIGGCGTNPEKKSDDLSVVIIGSGYGSAVTALRLTEAGIPVTILEMGRLWDTPAKDGNVFCSLNNADGRSMWFRDSLDELAEANGAGKEDAGAFASVIGGTGEIPKQAGVLDVVGAEDMKVSVGRGVGGGSLVNMSVYVTPQREVFSRVLPRVNADEMFTKYFRRAKSNLMATRVPASLIEEDCYQYSRVGIASAEAAGIEVQRVESGYDYDYMEKEVAGSVPRSALGNEAAFGNNHGKRSLDQTYLAQAMGTGLLTIHALHEVLRIEPQNGGGFVVRTKEIDIDGKVLAKADWPCSHLFIGAGSMGTSDLLVKSRERGDLPDLNAAVGTQWGPNSDIFVRRIVGATTGILQSTVPSSSFHTVDQDGKQVFSMIVPLPVGLDVPISMNIMMTENPEAGHFTYDSKTNKTSLQWSREQNEPAVKSSRYVFDKINKADGGSYLGELGDRASFHPVGGCPLGEATDDFGRIQEYPGLYVVDGSLVPVGLGANPALTITALAERNIERILAEDFEDA